LRDLGSRVEEQKQLAATAKAGSPAAGKDSPGKTGKEGGQEKPLRGGENQPGKEAGKDSPGKDSPEKTGENPAGGQQGKPPEKEPGKKNGPEIRKGVSELEMARASREISRLKTELESRTADLQGKLQRLAAQSEDAELPGEAKENFSAAARKNGQAGREIQQGDFAGAEKNQASAVEELEKAREEISRQLKEAKARNALQTAGLEQEESRLARKASSSSSLRATLEEDSPSSVKDDLEDSPAQGAVNNPSPAGAAVPPGAQEGSP
jgi:hypothetical protein